jgi:hypothetical protein
MNPENVSAVDACLPSSKTGAKTTEADRPHTA